MITYARNMYLSEKVHKKNSKTNFVEKIAWDIEHHAGMVSTTFISIALNDKDVFDILPPWFFKQKIEDKMNICIIGIAESETAAHELVGEMVEEYFEYNKGETMREYFIKKC